MRWTVVENEQVDKALYRAPKHITRKYQFWLEMMRDRGPEVVRTWKGFKDHALKGEWTGYRSSRLNKQFRVIYRVEHSRVIVFVEKIDPHRYR